MNIPHYHFGKRFSRIRDFFYWLKCKLFHPYNVVKITTLPPTWTDRPEVMLHANFQILVDYVEGEEPFKVLNWDWCEEKKRSPRAEIESLYNWWKFERQKKIDSIAERFSVEYQARGLTNLAQSLLDEETAIYEKEDEENLIRLMKIRRILWT